MDIVSMIQKQEADKAAARTLKVVQEANLKLVEGLLKRFSLQMDDGIRELVSRITVRCGKSIPLLPEELDAKDGEEFKNSEAVLKVGTEQDNKTGFPLLFFSSSRLEDGIRSERIRHEEKKRAEKEAFRKSEWLKKRQDWLRQSEGIEPSQCFNDFVVDLPAMRTTFDGSRQRVANVTRNNTIIQQYGNQDDEIFAVSFINSRGISEVRIFVKEIDFRKKFANQLIEKECPKKDAERISNGLSHDRWYKVLDKIRSKDEVLEYSREIAWRLRVKEGDKVHDLLQGDLDVVCIPITDDDGNVTKQCFVKVDPAKKSAILVGSIINLYDPFK